MAWEFGNQYRVRTVQGEAAIKTLPNEKRTMLVEIMFEVIRGPSQGQRAPYKGFLNSAENVQRTMNDLRAMGWTGKRWGDWSGLGGREFQAKLVADDGTDREGQQTQFPRFAFPRPLRTVSDQHVSSMDELDRLNAQFNVEAITEAMDHDAAEPPFDT